MSPQNLDTYLNHKTNALAALRTLARCIGNNVRNIFTMNSICYTIEHTRFQIQISILKKEQPTLAAAWISNMERIIFWFLILNSNSIIIFNYRGPRTIVLVFEVTLFMVMLVFAEFE